MKIADDADRLKPPDLQEWIAHYGGYRNIDWGGGIVRWRNIRVLGVPSSQRKSKDRDDDEGGAGASWVLWRASTAMTKHRCCDDCGLPKPAGPMLYHGLWRTAIAKGDNPWLCFDCTETRLGRPLTQADLIPCPYNAGWIPFDDTDVAAKQFARRTGRRLLAPR